MSIFNKLFSDKSSNEDDKYVLYAALGSMLALSDGDASQDEGKWVGLYISSIPGMTKRIDTKTSLTELLTKPYRIQICSKAK